MKSFKPKAEAGGEPPGTGGGRNGERDFHGERRRNDTHASTTDPDARLFRKGRGKEAKPCHMGYLLMENRNGLIVEPRRAAALGPIAQALDPLGVEPDHPVAQRLPVHAGLAGGLPPAHAVQGVGHAEQATGDAAIGLLSCPPAQVLGRGGGAMLEA
jgi:hypothetical protein